MNISDTQLIEQPRERRQASLVARKKLSKHCQNDTDSESDSEVEEGIFADSDEETGRKRKRGPTKRKRKNTNAKVVAEAAPAAVPATADTEETDAARQEAEILSRHEMHIESLRMNAQDRMTKDAHEGFLAVFLPILKNILQYPGQFENVTLQRTAALTMARYALIYL